jgi:hypothetical protein
VPPVDAHNPCADADDTRTGKTILASLIALAALASVAGSLAAGDTRTGILRRAIGRRFKEMMARSGAFGAAQ